MSRPKRTRGFQDFQDETKEREMGMVYDEQATHADDLHRRVQEFINSPDYPQRLRKNAALSYHPDLAKTEQERELLTDIMSRINTTCDRLEKEKK